MRVSAQYASTHFEDLLSATDRGEEVEIERVDAPVVRLSLVESLPKPQTRSIVGALRGQIWMADDFKSEADSEEMADLFEGNCKL
jgi:antitoxin (DNA-binding transcriptional repressor) of toxin-antitoxin stability system